MASAAQAAKHIFKSERQFMAMLDSGAMTRAPRGEYDLNKVRKERLEYLEAKRAADEGGGTSSLSEARTRVATAKAEIAERENETVKGTLCKIEDAFTFVLAELMVLRENIFSAPGKIADKLMQAENREDAFQIAYEEIWECMGRMAKGDDAIAFAIEVVQRAGGSKALLLKFLKDFKTGYGDEGEWGWDERPSNTKGDKHV